ncbi:MAG: prolipoprotein diacylglyceryl transferase [Bacteroidetes bacterium HGW-Bacteroidetes-16]|jgi:prolipoprotein diacylglyceryl transferase|nr:MAG: prolipoprotein diacylglyceryl transferase [Bacteroidetes bacterium HGW-Bacteroidetes-16]
MLLHYIVWNVRPEIFILPETFPLIGGFSVRWYGLLFALGFVLGYLILQKMFKKEGVPIKVLDDLATYMLIFTIVGARLGHCLFYEPDYYLAHPFEILKIWEGGLASHGAAVGILIGLYFFSRHYHRTYFWVLDHVVLVTALAGFLIRMGNLMNSEIYGDVTTLPWGFIFVRDGLTMAHHPTQIYEALSYLLLFIFLYRYYWKHDGKPVEGRIFAYFLIVLWTVRFLIEFIKLPQVDFESRMMLNMGQWLSIPLIIGGLVILYISGKKAIKPASK